MSGGVKVAVRVRPFNAREKEREADLIISMVILYNLIITNFIKNGPTTTIRNPETEEEKSFSYDYSFWSHDGYDIDDKGYSFAKDSSKYADQLSVYKVLGEEILDNAWTGYNCCLFAYGQTGSGKSYSMIGYGNNKGIVPITCNEIFKRIDKNISKSTNTSYEVSISMLEIYNEKVQDLLIDPSLRTSTGLKIRENKLLGPYVEGLTKYPVATYQDISEKMDEGGRNRTIGSTLMNATSSRAHTIITIEFKQIIKNYENTKPSEKISVINLVDLAGSERSSSTGATGSRLKEGCNINKSLLVLGNVINVLADKATGGKNKNMLPPYRDSALTRILQSALGGNSKTVMICALSPADINYEETLSTLRYADRAKKIQNKAIVNESQHDKVVRLLREENQELKKKLDSVLSSISLTGGKIKEEDKLKALEIKEEYEANVKLMENMQKSFEEKLKEAKEQSLINNNTNQNNNNNNNNNKTVFNELVDTSKPHLIVVNEDAQLSHKLKYSLNNLPVYVGRKTGNPKPKISLSGVGIKVNHAFFEKHENSLLDRIKLKASDSTAVDYIFINGISLNKLSNYENENKGVILNHLDKIILGSSSYMIYMHHSDDIDVNVIDWETMNEEFEKERDKEVQAKELEKENKKQSEINQIKDNMETAFNKEKIKIEEDLKQQLKEYEQKLKLISENKAKNILTKKRIKIVEILKEDKNIKTLAEKISTTTSLECLSNLKTQENKFKQNLINLAKKLVKFRNLIEKTNINISIDIMLDKEIDNSSTISEYKNNSINCDTISIDLNKSLNINFKVKNYVKGEVYYWDSEMFCNIYDNLIEHYEQYENNYLLGDYNVYNIEIYNQLINKSPIVLGYFIVSYKSLVYNTNISVKTPVFSNYSQNTIASVSFKITTIKNNKYNNIIKDPSFNILKDNKIIFDIDIESIEDISDLINLNSLYLQYLSLDNELVKVDVKTNQTTNNSINENKFNINHKFQQELIIDNEDDYDFIYNDCLIVKLYGIEKINQLETKTTYKDISNSDITKHKIFLYENKNNKLGNRSNTTNIKNKITNNSSKNDCLIF